MLVAAMPDMPVELEAMLEKMQPASRAANAASVEAQQAGAAVDPAVTRSASACAARPAIPPPSGPGSPSSWPMARPRRWNCRPARVTTASRRPWPSSAGPRPIHPAGCASAGPTGGNLRTRWMDRSQRSRLPSPPARVSSYAHPLFSRHPGAAKDPSRPVQRPPIPWILRYAQDDDGGKRPVIRLALCEQRLFPAAPLSLCC